jgi:hypothetical protein
MRDLVQEQGLARDIEQRFGRNSGLGMRAKDENSSTMRRRSPTWRTIVSVSRSKCRPSSASALP